MAIEIKQHLKLQQQLVMTPQLQQAIKLLQLSRMELADTIRDEILENPILEDAVDTASEEPKIAEVADGTDVEHVGETETRVVEIREDKIDTTAEVKADSNSNDGFAEPTFGGASAPPPSAAPAAAPPAPGQDTPGSADAPTNVTVTVDKANNALLIYGTPQQFSVIADVLHHMDVAPIQVQLEAVIAEVTLNDGLQYGVQYFYQPNNKHELVLSDSNSTNITPALPGFSYLFTQGTNIKVVLSALSQVTHVEVISSPNIMVLNNGTALLQVGSQVPIATGQAVNVSELGFPLGSAVRPYSCMRWLAPRG